MTKITTTPARRPAHLNALKIAPLLAALITGPVNAAEFTYKKMDTGNYAIELRGEIIEGDAQRLADTSKYVLDALHAKSAVLGLDSPGGDVRESMLIANMVEGNAATVVASGRTCASACFNILIAGNPRYADASARIGVHGTIDGKTNEDNATAKAVTVELARIYTHYNVPSAIIGQMVVTLPSSIYWLTLDDKRAMFKVVDGLWASHAPAPVPATAPVQWYWAKDKDQTCIPLEADTLEGTVVHTPQQVMAWFTSRGGITSIVHNDKGFFDFKINWPGKPAVDIIIVNNQAACRKMMAPTS